MLSSFAGKRDDLIPILQKIQEAFGYLPEDAMLQVAEFLRVPEAEVYGAATFYAQFKFTPTGRYLVQCCRGTACHVRGGRRILQAVERELGITEGHTTSDFEFTLERVACIGACALAPAMVVNEKVFGEMTPQKVKEALGALQNGKSDATAQESTSE